MINDKQIRVLIVDDDPIVTEIIRMQLTRLDHMVAGVVFNGPEAVRAVLELKPDLVLMDLRMADPDTGLEKRLAGLDAAREIQEKHPTPVIVLTAYESSELVQKASAVGVVGYLIKPVQRNQLERAITIALARFEETKQLRQLNEDLQVRNAELGVFAEYAAHDLKAPLAPIVGYAETLADESFSKSEIQSYLQLIARSGRKMSNVIDEFLRLASIRKEEISVGPLEMVDIFEAAHERVLDMLAEHDAQITLHGQLPAALGYGPWIEEVWVNYLSNAIKYGGESPCIKVGGERQADKIRFWVQDHGPGLTEEEQQQLFTPFERLSQLRASGHGLGLSIVHHIMKKLDGEVGVESVVGEGCTFYFTLPAPE